MSQPYPLPREVRSTGVLTFDGVSQVYGPIDFKIFDIEDVAVYVKHDGEDAYTKIEGLTVTKTGDLVYDTFSVDFGEVHPVSSSYVIQGERTPERSTAVTRGGGIDTQALEKDISKLAIEDQELRRDYTRSLKTAVGEELPDLPLIEPGKVLGSNTDGDRLVWLDKGDAGFAIPGDETVDTDKLVGRSVTSEVIAVSGVKTENLADLNVTPAKMSADDFGDNIRVAANHTNAVSRKLKEHFGDIPNINDWDGSDTTEKMERALLGSAGRTLLIPKGVYEIEDTLIIPAGTTLIGQGRMDYWELDEAVGTVLKTSGAGTAARWTDIDGADGADDTPLLVAGGNGVFLDNLSLLTSSDNWSMGILFPCVKQCGFNRVSGFGFADGVFYLDATWSDRNTVLKALHPSIATSSGMNEFTGTNFWAIAGEGGFAIKIQGSTRAGDSVASEPEWFNGWGGTSGIRFGAGRITGISASGGDFSHDVQLYGVGTYGQGVSFTDVEFRGNGAGYAVKLDRSNRQIFNRCYGEDVGGGTHAFAVTSRTQISVDGIERDSDKLNVPMHLDGVEVASGSSAPWHATRCVVTKRVNGGRMFTPNLELYGTADQPFTMTSFQSSGYSYFYQDDGSSRSLMWVLGDDLFRPATNGSAVIGSGSFRLDTIRLANSPDVSSDESLKDIIGPIDENEALMAAAPEFQFLLYRLKSAVEKKGDAARKHAGVGARAVVAICEKHGLDAFEMGFVGKDLIWDEETRKTGEVTAEDDPVTEIIKVPRLDENGKQLELYQIRYEELHSVVIASLMQRVAALEERCTKRGGANE